MGSKWRTMNMDAEDELKIRQFYFQDLNKGTRAANLLLLLLSSDFKVGIKRHKMWIRKISLWNLYLVVFSFWYWRSKTWRIFTVYFPSDFHLTYALSLISFIILFRSQFPRIILLIHFDIYLSFISTKKIHQFAWTDE